MTITEDQQAGLTELSYAQLTAALKASNDEYENRFTEFLAAAEQTHAAIAAGKPPAECRAELDSIWAGCKAQTAMTSALVAEISARRDRGDYA